MKKILFLLWISLISVGLYAQSAKDTIRWNADRKLTWDDFNGRVDASSPNAALTNTAIKINFGFSDKGDFKYNIICLFDKSKSWVRLKQPSILIHEQGHFDITELYARKLNKALKEYKYNKATVSRDISNIYQNLMAEHTQMQDDYDHETDHSRNAEEQQKWLKKIQADLKECEAYSKY